MVRPELKEEERRLAERFQRLCSDCPLGTFIEFESPDLLLSHPGGTLGIEVTRYVRESGDLDESPGQERYRNDVLQHARTAFESDGGPPLHVSAFWQQSPVLGRDVPRLSASLARLVRSRVPVEGATEEFGWDDFEEPLQDVLGELTVHRFDPRGGANWYSPVASMGRADARVIRKLIAKKQALLKSYRERVRSIWLLVVAGSSNGPATFLHDRREAVREMYEADFERVYLLDLWDGTVCPLKTSRPAASI